MVSGFTSQESPEKLNQEDIHHSFSVQKTIVSLFNGFFP